MIKDFHSIFQANDALHLIDPATREFIKAIISKIDQDIVETKPAKYHDVKRFSHVMSMTTAINAEDAMCGIPGTSSAYVNARNADSFEFTQFFKVVLKEYIIRVVFKEHWISSRIESIDVSGVKLNMSAGSYMIFGFVVKIVFSGVVDISWEDLCSDTITEEELQKHREANEENT